MIQENIITHLGKIFLFHGILILTQHNWIQMVMGLKTGISGTTDRGIYRSEISRMNKTPLYKNFRSF